MGTLTDHTQFDRDRPAFAVMKFDDWGCSPYDTTNSTSVFASRLGALSLVLGEDMITADALEPHGVTFDAYLDLVGFERVMDCVIVWILRAGYDVCDCESEMFVYKNE